MGKGHIRHRPSYQPDTKYRKGEAFRMSFCKQSSSSEPLYTSESCKPK